MGPKKIIIVRLVPIPSYEDGKTFIPILDYTSVILDQSTYTYSVLTLQEEQECISSRCYVQDTERPLSQTACGVPQFYEQQKDTCVYEETQSNGIFLKSMLPDGVFFAFRSEVNSQLFCNDNKDKNNNNNNIFSSSFGVVTSACKTAKTGNFPGK